MACVQEDAFCTDTDSVFDAVTDHLFVGVLAAVGVLRSLRGDEVDALRVSDEFKNSEVLRKGGCT